MQFINNQGITDPAINLAIEEYVLKNLPIQDDGYLLFYINEPAIIIGKHQNTLEEINQAYVEEKGIHVVRRLSGGGAVYHDLGNLNFSFLTKDDGRSFHNFKKFTEPVVQSLKMLGVEAELTGRNDIQVGEKKISGNAQFISRDRMFSHGTLLFSTNLDEVMHALRANAEKIKSKSTKSIRSRVANIEEFLNHSMDISQFCKYLLHNIFKTTEIPEYHLTLSDWEKIHEISKKRYKNWDWNYGESPACNIRMMKRFPVGIIDVRLYVDKGIIKEVKIFGDFFGKVDVAELEALMLGLRYEKQVLADALQNVSISDYFGKMTVEEFLDLLTDLTHKEANPHV